MHTEIVTIINVRKKRCKHKQLIKIYTYILINLSRCVLIGISTNFVSNCY